MAILGIDLGGSKIAYSTFFRVRYTLDKGVGIIGKTQGLGGGSVNW